MPEESQIERFDRLHASPLDRTDELLKLLRDASRDTNAVDVDVEWRHCRAWMHPMLYQRRIPSGGLNVEGLRAAERAAALAPDDGLAPRGWASCSERPATFRPQKKRSRTRTRCGRRSTPHISCDRTTRRWRWPWASGAQGRGGLVRRAGPSAGHLRRVAAGGDLRRGAQVLPASPGAQAGVEDEGFDQARRGQDAERAGNNVAYTLPCPSHHRRGETGFWGRCRGATPSSLIACGGSGAATRRAVSGAPLTARTQPHPRNVAAASASFARIARPRSAAASQAPSVVERAATLSIIISVGRAWSPGQDWTLFKIHATSARPATYFNRTRSSSGCRRGRGTLAGGASASPRSGGGGAAASSRRRQARAAPPRRRVPAARRASAKHTPRVIRGEPPTTARRALGAVLLERGVEVVHLCSTDI